MKKLKTITIICLACAALCLCALLGILLFSGRGFRFADGNQIFSPVLEKEFDAADIRSLKIEYGMNSNDVIFYQGTGESIVVREYLNFKPRENQISTVTQKGSELQITGSRRNSFFFFSFRPRNAYTEIILPAGFAENMDTLYVKTMSGEIDSELPFKVRDKFSAFSTSGDIALSDVEADEIQLSSTSGDIRLPAARCEAFSASTTSGDIAVEQVNGRAVLSSVSGEIVLKEQQGDMKASSTSGDIRIGQVSGKSTLSSTSGEILLKEQKGDVEASSSSGDIGIEELQGSFAMDTSSGAIRIAGGNSRGRAETVSGDVQLFLAGLTGDLDISTTSGEVNLRLPETASFSLDFDSTSGECSTFFDEQLSFNKKGNKADGQYRGGAGKVQVSTTSGDLKISRY